MKRLLLILILTLSYQSLTKADDISDFQIEGISVGDNLLDHFSKEEINKRDIFYYPKSKKFVGISFANQNFYKIFKSVQFTFSENDKKIVGIGGRIFFPNDIQGCLKKKDEIVKELSEMFGNEVTIQEVSKAHRADKSGKSKITSIYFIFKNDDAVKVNCYDWDKNMKYKDALVLNIDAFEYRNFLSNEAYK